MVVLPISIHAPTRGATACEALAAKTVVFQSTLPRGERRMGKIDTSGLSNFNPRSHEGSDAAGVCCGQCWKHFNPRSHEGSDQIALVGHNLTIHFNPRSHEGSDYLGSLSCAIFSISIHAPTRGATSNVRFLLYSG